MSPKRPPFIVSSSGVAETTPRYPDSDEALCFKRTIGRAAGLERVALHMIRLPPGHRSTWPHAEEGEEEFVLVIEGEVDMWIDGTLHPMRSGDLAGFKAGTGICHATINNSDREALLLVGGEASKDENRFAYPLNPERRAQMKPSEWWSDMPLAPQGPHDGLPDARRLAASQDRKA